MMHVMNERERERILYLYTVTSKLVLRHGERIVRGQTTNYYVRVAILCYCNDSEGFVNGYSGVGCSDVGVNACILFCSHLSPLTQTDVLLIFYLEMTCLSSLCHPSRGL